MEKVIIAPRSEFQEKYLNTNADIIVAGGSYGCVPAETEFLTPTGWKKISDYQEGDQVGTISLDSTDYNNTGLFFEKPSKYIKLECKSMSSIESARFGMTLSDEHRVVYWEDKKPGYRVIPWLEVLSRHSKSKNKGFWGRYRTSVDHVERRGVDMTDWEIRLQVAVAADGHFVPEGANNYCQISISKDRKVKRLKWICDNGGFDLRLRSTYYDERYSNGKIDNFVVHPRFRVKNLNELFWEADNRQLAIIFEEIFHWDGHIPEGKEKQVSNIFYTKVKEEADFVQYVGTVLGKTTSIYFDEREGKECYYVFPSKSGARSFANKDGKPPIKTVQMSDGYKYCFSVSTGFLLLRENGNIFVTGNSSKSYIGLMRHLRWVHDKHYRGYTIRKNSTTLMKAGGLFEEAYQMYSAFDPGLKMRIKDQKLVFSTGASVSFSHYENSKSSEIYRGLQLSSVFYDEATDAAEEDIWFLIGRLRTQAKMTPSIWLTCNPNPDSYLRDWVDWWLYPEGHPQAGLPNPERNGVIRYMVRLDGQLYWGASKKIVIEKWGNPDLPHDHKKQIKPMSFTCLFGTIKDNPVLMDTNPNYVATLEALPEVDKQRYLYGNWNVRPMGSQFFERKWVEEVSDIDPSEIVSTARAFDFAGALKSDINPNPDYTASVRMHKLKDGTYYIDEVTRTRIRPGKWKEFVLDLALGDPLGTTYYIPQDPGPAAKRACNLFIRELISHGLSARRMSTNKSKLDRFRPFSSMAQSGGIKVKKGCASDQENDIENDNRFYYKEMEAFDGKSSNAQHKHDDMCDATSDAFYALASKRGIITDFSSSLRNMGEGFKQVLNFPN